MIVSATNQEYGAFTDYLIGFTGARDSTAPGHAGSRRGLRVPSTSPRDLSFNNESRIFGHVGLESSVISPSQIDGFPNTPTAPTNQGLETRKQKRERLEREGILRSHARTPVRAGMKAAPAMAESVSQKMYRIGDKLLDGVASLIKLFLQ